MLTDLTIWLNAFAEKIINIVLKVLKTTLKFENNKKLTIRSKNKINSLMERKVRYTCNIKISITKAYRAVRVVFRNVVQVYRA